MKRTFLVAAAALTVGVAAFAAAATLGVSASNLGAGDADVTSCVDLVETTFDTAFDDTASEFQVVSVEVTGLDGCNGQELSVVLTDSAGESIGDGDTTVSGSTEIVPVSPNPASEAVEGVHVQINQ